MHIRNGAATSGDDGRDPRRRRALPLMTLAAVLVASGAAGTATAQTAANALTTCYRATALDAATKTCDPPGAVVETTYRACIQQEENWREALLKAGGVYGGTLATNIFTRFKANARGILMTLVTKTRAEKGLCRLRHTSDFTELGTRP